MTTQTDLAFAREDEMIPDDARLVRDFLNTVEHQEGVDSLQHPADLDAWLLGRGLAGDRVRSDDADLDRARSLREGLRAVLTTHAGHPPADEALRRLDHDLATYAVRLSFADPLHPTLVAAGERPVDQAMARVIAAMHGAMLDGSWTRLKACDRSTCRWAYFDYSRNRSARWCTMAGCGNAVKMQRAYATRKARSGGTALPVTSH